MLVHAIVSCSELAHSRRHVLLVHRFKRWSFLFKGAFTFCISSNTNRAGFHLPCPCLKHLGTLCNVFRLNVVIFCSLGSCWIHYVVWCNRLSRGHTSLSELSEELPFQECRLLGTFPICPVRISGFDPGAAHKSEAWCP